MSSIGGAVALALGVWISGQFWNAWQERRAPELPRSVPAHAVLPNAPSPAPDQKISLLGTDASLSRKPLRLVLVSTHQGPTLAESAAALGTDPRNPQTYAGGAVLSNGARIVDIRPDHVLLSLHGRTSMLAIESGTASRAATVVEGTGGDAVSIGAEGGAEERPVSDADSRPDLSEFLRPQPVYDHGSLSGLLILPGTDASRLALLGLEPGDVIRAVSAAPVTDAAWQEIDDVLSTRGSLTVEVERRGKRISISLDGARLAGATPAI